MTTVGRAGERRSVYVGPAQAGDEAEINALRNTVFGLNRSMAAYRRKFAGNPASDGNVLIVAKAGGKIVGIFMSLGLRFKVGLAERIVSLPVDTAVLPEYRSRGQIFWEMFEAYCREVRSKNIGLAFGFPNEVHYRVGARLLGYAPLLELPVLWKRLNWRPAFRRRVSSARPRGWARWLESVVGSVSATAYYGRTKIRPPWLVGGATTERVEAFDARVDTFWRETCSRFRIIGLRDRAYLAWRYPAEDKFVAFAACAGGRMVGYLVLKEPNPCDDIRVGHILDFLTVDRLGAARSLLKHALLYLLGRGTDYVKCAMLPGNHLDEALRRFGFSDRGERLRVVHKVYDPAVDARLVSDSANWFITYGDSADFLAFE